MDAVKILASCCSEAVEAVWGVKCDPSSLQFSLTRKEFDGDYTLVVFPLLRTSKSSPENTGKAIGEYLTEHCPEVSSFNVVKGFLNICLSARYWMEVLQDIIRQGPSYGQLPSTGKTIMVEYSSPNTNKPLHLGHVRNNLLGSSVSTLLERCGNTVIKVNLVNDRGIHICKSMYAWKKLYDGKTPADCGKKGDHFVGDCYVAFNNMYKDEVAQLVASGMDEKEAEKKAPCLVEAQKMLLKWEQGDPEVRGLWEMMNSWVYDGFAKTYSDLGISFDKTYYESQTYLDGKALVAQGLESGVFYKEADGSVWCDLTADGLDKKLLLRGDGTSVYMTQDLGTAKKRFEENSLDKHIYVVGNEQNYHFQVLKLILGKLGFKWADEIYHLSYGMVELPEGKMKSREGTVVDADDLMEKMYQTARETSLERGKLDDMTPEQQDELFRMIGLGALKYFILKVDPVKTMLFDPKESIDFNGNTGSFIQYTHARIKSILVKAAQGGVAMDFSGAVPGDRECSLIKALEQYPSKVREAGESLSPSLIANYSYDLAKEFNQFYHDCPVMKEENSSLKALRLNLIGAIAQTLESSMGILGVSLPDKM